MQTIRLLLLTLTLCAFQTISEAQKIKQLPGKAIDIAGSEGGQLYAIAMDKTLIRWDNNKKSWQPIPKSKRNLRSVTIIDGFPYVIDNQNEIHHYRNGKWFSPRQTAIEVAQSHRAYYAISECGNLREWNEANNDWKNVFHDVTNLVNVSAVQKRIFVNDQKRQSTYEVLPGGKTKLLPGKANDLATNSRSLVKVGHAFRLNRFNFSKGKWELQYQPKNDFKKITLRSDQIYAVDKSNRIFRLEE